MKSRASREYIELINETHILKGYQHPVDIYPVQQVQHLWHFEWSLDVLSTDWII